MTQKPAANNNKEEAKQQKTGGRILRTVAIVVVAALLIGAFVASVTHRAPASDQAWDLAMTQGNSEAKNLYVMYTDIMCPYCDVFSRAVMEHQDEFEKFLADNDVLFEVRLTDTLYHGYGSEMSRDSAEAAYCAKRENRFWDYYHGALNALWEDYHSKGIGNNKSAKPITDMPDDYWLKIGREIGLGDTFEQCVNNRETADEVEDVTRRSSQYAEGMPTFKFGDFSTSGFSDTWGWDEAKILLEQGCNNSYCAGDDV